MIAYGSIMYHKGMNLVLRMEKVNFAIHYDEGD